MSVQVIGVGSHLPGEPVGNDVVERLVGPLPADVAAEVSIETRYWLIDPATGEHRDSNSRMAAKAARAALDSADIDAGEVDLLVLATATPEYPLPPTANLVQDLLGVGHCATVELRSAGAGAVQGIEIARLYLASGAYRTALVIGSEATSPALAPIFLGVPAEKVRIRDRIPAYMFGDGAGAVLLRRVDGAAGGLLGGAAGAVGPGRPPGIQVVGGGTHAPIHVQQAARRLVTLTVDMVAAGRFAPVLVADAIGETLARCGAAPDTVDVCVVPEGNAAWMRGALAGADLTRNEWQRVGGEFVDSLHRRGALGSAGPLVCLDDAWRDGRLKPGQRALLVGIEASKWLHAGVLVDWTLPGPAVAR